MAHLKYADLIFVSENEGKYQEYAALLGLADLKWSRSGVEESQNLEMQALVRQKIDHLRARLPGIPFFVEHSGLIIDAWRGLPGGLTAQFMKTVGAAGLCRMMQAYDHERGALARAVIGFYHPGTQQIILCQGDAFGQIAPEPRHTPGVQAFGWDAIFIPEGDTRTYAEMPLEEKNLISMRRSASQEFARYLDKYFVL